MRKTICIVLMTLVIGMMIPVAAATPIDYMSEVSKSRTKMVEKSSSTIDYMNAEKVVKKQKTMKQFVKRITKKVSLTDLTPQKVMKPVQKKVRRPAPRTYGVRTSVITTPTPTNGDFACSDGIDNDNDGAVDFPDDLGCESPIDQDETNDPMCEKVNEVVTDFWVGINNPATIMILGTELEVSIVSITDNTVVLKAKTANNEEVSDTIWIEGYDTYDGVLGNLKLHGSEIYKAHGVEPIAVRVTANFHVHPNTKYVSFQDGTAGPHYLSQTPLTSGTPVSAYAESNNNGGYRLVVNIDGSSGVIEEIELGSHVIITHPNGQQDFVIVNYFDLSDVTNNYDLEIMINERMYGCDHPTFFG